MIQEIHTFESTVAEMMIFIMRNTSRWGTRGAVCYIESNEFSWNFNHETDIFKYKKMSSLLKFIDVPVLTNGLEDVPLEIVAPDLKLLGKGCGGQFPNVIGISSISSSSSSCKMKMWKFILSNFGWPRGSWIDFNAGAWPDRVTYFRNTFLPCTNFRTNIALHVGIGLAKIYT